MIFFTQQDDHDDDDDDDNEDHDDEYDQLVIMIKLYLDAGSTDSAMESVLPAFILVSGIFIRDDHAHIFHDANQRALAYVLIFVHIFLFNNVDNLEQPVLLEGHIQKIQCHPQLFQHCTLRLRKD